jgi:hypothetical protein
MDNERYLLRAISHLSNLVAANLACGEPVLRIYLLQEQKRLASIRSASDWEFPILDTRYIGAYRQVGIESL